MPKFRVVRTFIAKCHNEPRGKHGLEGYQKGGDYPAQERENDLGRYYAVQPDKMFPDYWEPCPIRTFNTYFKEVSTPKYLVTMGNRTFESDNLPFTPYREEIYFLDQGECISRRNIFVSINPGYTKEKTCQ